VTFSAKEVNVQAVMMSSWDFSRLSRSVRDVRMEALQVSAIFDFVGYLRFERVSKQKIIEKRFEIGITSHLQFST